MRLGTLVAIVLAVAACGGDESSAEEWANDVCGNLSEWVTGVDETVRSLTDEGLSLDAAAVRGAIDETKAATDDLANDLEELGNPETEAGREAVEELDELTGALRSQSEAVERAIDEDREPLDLVATVAGAISTALNRLHETFENHRGLDPGGELADAFTNAEDCVSLGERVESIRS